MSKNRARISFQGERGAYSHLACIACFDDALVLPCDTFEEALAAVEDGQAGCAMIPIENSLAGRVADILSLLFTTRLFVVQEYFLPVRHHLLALPGTPLVELETVQSHIQALGQCRRMIQKLGLTPVVAADTAGSARQIREQGDPRRSAIASQLAADIFELEILASDIQDAERNTTRFLVLQTEESWADASTGPIVSSLQFTLRSIPSALYKALGGFATNGVNLTRLESSHVPGNFGIASFFCDIDGHPTDPPVARALEELEYFSQSFRILGAYPASSERQQPLMRT